MLEGQKENIIPIQSLFLHYVQLMPGRGVLDFFLNLNDHENSFFSTKVINSTKVPKNELNVTPLNNKKIP
jgi:hypothetical protein